MSTIPVRSSPLEDAKPRLGELLDEVARSGPQVVTRGGVDAAVVVSARDWARLVQRRPP